MSGSKPTPEEKPEKAALALLAEFSENLNAKLSRLLVVSGLLALLIALDQQDQAVKLLDSDIPGFTTRVAIGAGFWINAYTITSIGMFHFLRGAKTTRVLLLQDVRGLIRAKSEPIESLPDAASSREIGLKNPDWIGPVEDKVNQESKRAESIFKSFHYYFPILFGAVTCLYSMGQGFGLLAKLISIPFEELSYYFVLIFAGRLLMPL